MSTHVLLKNNRDESPTGNFTFSGVVRLNDNLVLGTTTAPGSPASGLLVIYWDGTNLKAKTSAGTVHTIF